MNYLKRFTTDVSFMERNDWILSEIMTLIDVTEPQVRIKEYWKMLYDGIELTFNPYKIRITNNQLIMDNRNNRTADTYEVVQIVEEHINYRISAFIDHEISAWETMREGEQT